MIPREQCTVGALRARAASAGVDTEVRSLGTPPPRPESPIRIIDLAARATAKEAS